MNISYGIVAIAKQDVFGTKTPITILHFTGYEELPVYTDWFSLYEELHTDPEFGLTEVDFILLPATPSVVERFRESFRATSGDHHFVVKIV